MTPYHNRFLLRPAAREEAGLFYSDDQADRALGTVGHVRMDFGSSGKGFYHTWWPHNRNRFNTPEFKEILQQFVDTLRQDGPLKDLPSMERFCRQNGGAITEDSRSYGYLAEVGNYRFCLRCTPCPGEYQCYLYCYDLRRQTMDRPVGRISFANGERMEFTDPQEYLRAIREELPTKDVTGFRFETLTDDPAVHKAADDMAYDLYGEENPRPDPVTTEALYRFDRECAESEYIDMLTALRVVARNFSGETLQGAYEIIQHQNTALPSEMFAAVYLQAGRTPAEVSQLAEKGALMGFFGPERPEEPSRIAVCTVLEEGREQWFYTMDFGRFNPQHALKRAITYGRKAGISTTQAMACLTTDQPGFVKRAGGPRCILHGMNSELTEALFQIQPDCPAVAAHITCNADLGIAEVACHPLWLERNQSQTSMQRM